MQNRTFEYNTPITSFRYNRLAQGFNQPGLYYGYDSIEQVVGPTVSFLLKNNSGLSVIGADGTTESSAKAKLVTKQGLTIEIDEEPQLTISNTPGNARIDLVVLNHSYQEVSGGASATISIITGTPSPSPGPLSGAQFTSAPNLPNPNSQIIIGYLHIKKSGNGGLDARTFSDITYTPNYVEITKNLKPLLLDKNRVKTNGFDTETSQALDLTSGSVYDAGNKALILPLNTKSNVYRLTGPSGYAINKIGISGTFNAGDNRPNQIIPTGTKIRLEFVTTDNPTSSTSYLSIELGSPSSTSYLRPIFTQSGSAQPTSLFFMVRTNGFVELRYNGTEWLITALEESLSLKASLQSGYFLASGGSTLRVINGGSAVLNSSNYPLSLNECNNADWVTNTDIVDNINRVMIRKKERVNTAFTNLAAPYLNYSELSLDVRIRFNPAPAEIDNCRAIQLILPNAFSSEDWSFPTDEGDCTIFTGNMAIKTDVSPRPIINQPVIIQCIPNSKRVVIMPQQINDKQGLDYGLPGYAVIQDKFRFLDFDFTTSQFVFAQWAELRFSKNVVVRNLPY